MEKRLEGRRVLITQADDYMGPATPGKDLWATGECYKRTRNIAFVRARAFHDDPEDPIGTCVAAFMMDTPNIPRGDA